MAGWLAGPGLARRSERVIGRKVEQKESASESSINICASSRI